LLKSKGQEPLATPAAKVGTSETISAPGGVGGAGSTLPVEFHISH